MSGSNEFVIQDGELIEYRGPGGDVVVPEGVTRVGAFSFKDCESLTSIVLPEGVEMIEDYSFCGCKNLKRVILPKSLYSMGRFQDCTSLEEIVLPDDLHSIPVHAFQRCTSLREITIPRNVAWIGAQAFASCTSLTTVTLPEGLQEIGSDAFLACINLERINLPHGLRIIGDRAFASCGKLKEAALPESLEEGSIGIFAFPAGCRLSVPSGSYAEQYVKETAIDPEDFVIKDGVLQKYVGPGGEVRIPAGVTVIGEKAFFGNNSVQRVMVPEGVIKIEDAAFMDCRLMQMLCLPKSLTEAGPHAFWRCVQLSLVVSPPTVQVSSEALVQELREKYSNNFVIVGNCITRYLGPGGDATNKYEAKNPEVDVVIPDGIREIGRLAFNMWESIRTLSLPVGLEYIGWRAFGNCRGITELVLPEGLRELADGAFEKCKTLKSVTLPQSLEKVGRQVFSPQYRLSEVTVREWTPVVTEAVKGCELEKIHTEDISKVPTRYRTAAAVGFSCEESPDPNSERGKEHVAYLKRNAGKLAARAIKYPELLHFLLENQLLTGNTLDIYIEEAEASRRRGIKELRDALYRYRDEMR